MISKKVYEADGTTNRFLSDFIIRSADFAKPYAYVYDDSLPLDGTGDVLQDPSVDWKYPTNIYKRGKDLPQSEDLVTADKWQVVSNSVLFYLPPTSGTTIWVEVATTSEEIGTSLTQPSVERAEDAALRAEAEALRAEADADLAKQYAIDAALGGGAGQFLGLAQVKAVQYSAQESPDTMTLFEGLNGLAVDSFTLLEGAEFIIEDGAVFKVV